MLSGYQTYIPVDSFGLVFKKEKNGEYAGYIIFTRGKKAVMAPCEEGIYLGLHRMLEKVSKGFEQMEENGPIHISTGFES